MQAANHNLALAGAVALGCRISNISAMDLMHSRQNNTMHLVLGVLWQIVKAGFLTIPRR